MRRAHYARKSKKPLVASIAAILVVAAMIGGAFAWSDFTQAKTNKFKGSTDADVTLHDEFDGTNKDVFVENSGTSPIYVRVRLDEYMQIDSKSFVPTALVKDKSTWTPHTYDEAAIEDCEQVTAPEHLFHSYYKWEMSGAERNFNEGTPGLVYSKLGADGKVDLTSGTNPTAAASAPITMSKYLALKTLAESQTAKDWGWQAAITDPTDQVIWTAATTTGCWILDDTDTVANGGAWAYWSVPLAPGAATNLLLDSVAKTVKDPTDDWYYGIDVKLQAVTANDFAKWNEGTYKTTTDANTLIDMWK